MDGAGLEPDIKDLSRAQGFAQRAITSGFALSVFNGAYDPKTSNRSLLGQHVFKAIGTEWTRAEKEGKKYSDAVRYFEDWHRLRKLASTQTLRDLKNYGSGLKYLNGLENVQTLDKESIEKFGYIPLVGASLVALDSIRTEKKKSAADVRIDLAEAILETVAKRWKPREDGKIHLPGIVIGWLANSTGVRQSGGPANKELLTDFDFQPSGDAIRRYPTHKDSSCVDYMLALAFDVNPLPMKALLRWALDLTSALLAIRCLHCTSAESRGRHEWKGHTSNFAFDAESVEGFAGLLLGPVQQPLLDNVGRSTVERLSHLVGSERDLRTMWGDMTFRFGRKSLAWIWSVHGTESSQFLRAFRRHAVPPLPSVLTEEGSEIQRQLQYAKSPELLALADMSMGIQDSARTADWSRSSSPGGENASWTSTLQSSKRAMAQSFLGLVERCSAEDRTPSREEYEGFLKKLQNGQAELSSKTPPPRIRELLQNIKGKNPRGRSR